MKNASRTVILGLDGVPFHLLDDLASCGVMPNVAQLIADGFFRPIASTIPEVSSVAWSSIITGKNPGEHGIFGFTDTPHQTYRLSFPNFNSLKCDPFWIRNGGRAVIMNVPSTFPVREMNGVHISGFVSLDLKRSVYPETLYPLLKEMDYRVDVDSDKARDSMKWFLKDLDTTLQARRKACHYLWENEEWQVFMMVFTGTDRLMHFLWDAYEDESHQYHADFMQHFTEVDKVIGEITSQLQEDDILVLLSDHGFERLDKNVYVNFVLRESGFLALDEDCKGYGLGNLDENTKAFSLDPARIYINSKDRYPRGGIAADEVEGVITELIETFEALELEGRKVCKHIYRKEDVYTGPYVKDAPDLILIGSEGFNLHSSMKAKTLSDRGIFTGKHTQHDAFLLVKKWSDDGELHSDFNVSNILEIVDEIKAGRGRIL